MKWPWLEWTSTTDVRTTVVRSPTFMRGREDKGIATDGTDSPQTWMIWPPKHDYNKFASPPKLKQTVLFCSLSVLDPRVDPTMDVLSPFISVLCHSGWLLYEESCPRIDVVHPGRAWSSSNACTWHRSLHYLFSPGNSLVSSQCDYSMLSSLLWQCLSVPSLLQLC